MADASSPITRVLQAIGAGQLQASAQLLPLVYDELRRLAASNMAKEAPGQTLQPTALVHEAFLRVVGSGDPSWNGRGHFFGAAAQAMRRILVEQARRKGRIRHGGGMERVDAANVEPIIEPPTDDILALDEALTELEGKDPRSAEIVKLRYFAGLTADETANVLGLSVGTINREWRYIKSWLYDRLRQHETQKGTGSRGQSGRTTS